jgi:hypothetical protein
MAIEIEQIYGKWTVLRKDETNKRKWVCKCSCEKGTEKPVTDSTLTNGSSTNCGCGRKNWYDKKSKEEKAKIMQETFKKTMLDTYGYDNLRADFQA